MRVSFDYKPAHLFACRAHEWYGCTLALQNQAQSGEPPMLVLIYSVMSLEAFLDEQLDARLGIADKKGFMHQHKCASLMTRWSNAIEQLAKPDTQAQESLRDLETACGDDGTFGLLVRARNKLVHPGRVTEVSDASGNKIEDNSIDRLIQKVQKPPVSIPRISAQFPAMLQCRASAEWSLATLQLMIRGFYKVVSEPLPDRWARVFIR